MKYFYSIYLLIISLSSNIIILAQTSQNIPKVEIGACPFEGCQFGRWICRDTINVYENENDTTNVKFVLHDNDTIDAITGDIYYERYGKVLITKPIYDFNVNDTLIILGCGEGIYQSYYKGKPYQVEVFWPILNDEIDDDIINEAKIEYYGKLIENPKMVWCVKIIKGTQKGWLFLRNIEPFCFGLDEHIDGMDSLN